MKRSKYFDLQELVCPHIYNQYGEYAWNLIPQWLITTMDNIREHFNKPVYINNYKWNGGNSQRTIRCPKCELYSDHLKSGKLYMSAHVLFQAVDFNIKGMTSKEIVDEIIKHQDKFPYIKRIENTNYTPTWVHIDTRDHGGEGIKIFKPY